MRHLSKKLILASALLAVVCSVASVLRAQTANNAIVPPLVKFSGNLLGFDGTLPATEGITFCLYKEAQGGAPVWMETQSVQVDRQGNYSVMLGSTTSQGLPADMFVSGEARWLGVQISGQPEQQRVLLLSVPYALKAADAETLGGYPLSAFVLAQPGSPAVVSNSAVPAAASATSAGAAPPPASSNVTTSGGTANAIPLFTTASNIQNSILTQTGATAVNVAGKLNLPAQGVATATGGKFSRPETFVASAFNSTSSVAVPQTFQLQVEPAGNNTAAPSGTFNLLYGSGTTAPAETGMKISSKGLITFAAGQTFPGTGKGTITSVIAGTGLTGGGTAGAVTLNLNTANIPQLGTANDFTAPQEFKANAGVGIAPSGNGYTPLSVGGATSFGTWLALANSSSGGHTWNIISAGSGNAEGAGNLGITDLTGKSTIWLEGNTNTANLTATGTVGAAALVVSSTAGAAIIDADGFGTNAGGPTPGLRFGGGSSGEGIASNRVIGFTKFGLDFYTNYTARMSVLQNGQVGIGTQNPAAQLAVVASAAGNPAIYGQAGDAVSGTGQNGSDGIDAYGSAGDDSSSFTGGGGNGGVFQGGAGHYGGYGIYATGGFSGASGANTAAGIFEGDVLITGTLYGGAVSRIDHPLDPSNKYLNHTSVESSEMKNMYDGVVTLDASGEATVSMPDWFSALNRDFRYQLTCIGGFAPIYVAAELANNQFKIGGGHPGMKVSWQVTGIRQDAWANAHPMTVEVQKDDRERGFFLSPEVFGAPPEKSVAWARSPEMMKRLKRMRAQAAAARSAANAPR